MKSRTNYQRRQLRVRRKLSQISSLPRLTVFRSNHHLWAQIIDDQHHHTLLSLSTKNLPDKKGTKTELASLLGDLLAVQAFKLNLKKVKFDRGAYKYHGRIKALAEAARAKGLVF